MEHVDAHDAADRLPEFRHTPANRCALPSGASLAGQTKSVARVHARARASTGAQMEKIRIEQHSASGLLWIGGWLFTIGYLQLTFWKALLAIAVWPYYIGISFASAVR
jgi:hypothetical protein